jgi:hypothetical protein
MKTFKITNITNFAGKREPKFNTAIDIEYIDNRTKKIINLKAGKEVFLTVDSLPLSIHRLRIKKLITIEEVNLSEQNKLTEKSKPIKKVIIEKPKPIKKVIIEKKEEFEVEKKNSIKKKTITE